MSPSVTPGASERLRSRARGGHLFYWSLIFLVMAIIAALVGVGAIVAAGIAKLLFAVFAALFLVSFLAHLTRLRPQ